MTTTHRRVTACPPALVLLLALTACNQHTEAASVAGAGSNAPSSCAPPSLTVTTPEQTFAARAATSVLSRRSPAVLDIWIADYTTPRPDAPLTPGQSAAPAGHARVRLELLAAPGKQITGPGSYPATADKSAVGRATVIVETETRQHAAYRDITGQAHLSTFGKHDVCGTFDIGDTTTHASGTFAIRLS